jgi:hypothetical protein
MKKYVFFALSLAIVSCGDISSTEAETAVDTTTVFVDTADVMVDSTVVTVDTLSTDSVAL